MRCIDENGVSSDRRWIDETDALLNRKLDWWLYHSKFSAQKYEWWTGGECTLKEKAPRVETPRSESSGSETSGGKSSWYPERQKQNEREKDTERQTDIQKHLIPNETETEMDREKDTERERDTDTEKDQLDRRLAWTREALDLVIRRLQLLCISPLMTISSPGMNPRRSRRQSHWTLPVSKQQMPSDSRSTAWTGRCNNCFYIIFNYVKLISYGNIFYIVLESKSLLMFGNLVFNKCMVMMLLQLLLVMMMILITMIIVKSLSPSRSN